MYIVLCYWYTCDDHIRLYDVAPCCENHYHKGTLVTMRIYNPIPAKLFKTKERAQKWIDRTCRFWKTKNFKLEIFPVK